MSTADEQHGVFRNIQAGDDHCGTKGCILLSKQVSLKYP